MTKDKKEQAETATNLFLNLLINKFNLKNDTELAQALAVSTAQIGNYRTGRRELSDTYCVKVAKKMGFPKHFVLLKVWESRENDPEISMVYRDLLRTYIE